MVFQGPETGALLASAHTLWGALRGRGEGERRCLGLELELQVRCRDLLLIQEMKSNPLAVLFLLPSSVQPVLPMG